MKTQLSLEEFIQYIQNLYKNKYRNQRIKLENLIKQRNSDNVFPSYYSWEIEKVEKELKNIQKSYDVFRNNWEKNYEIYLNQFSINKTIKFHTHNLKWIKYEENDLKPEYDFIFPEYSIDTKFNIRENKNFYEVIEGKFMITISKQAGLTPYECVCDFFESEILGNSKIETFNMGDLKYKSIRKL